MQCKICKNFGKHVKELREKRGKSLNLFAYENDLTPATLSRIENGLVDPKLSTLDKIAQAFEIPLDELMKF